MARLMMHNAVESLGNEILVASNGHQAWDMLTRTSVDVVVSDWMMPGVDGPELCRRVRAQVDGRYTYFILLTTLADRRYALEGMEAGADDYLPKPLDIGELQLRLIAAQRITQLHKELLERDLGHQGGDVLLVEIARRNPRVRARQRHGCSTRR